MKTLVLLSTFVVCLWMTNAQNTATVPTVEEDSNEIAETTYNEEYNSTAVPPTGEESDDEGESLAAIPRQ